MITPRKLSRAALAVAPIAAFAALLAFAPGLFGQQTTGGSGSQPQAKGSQPPAKPAGSGQASGGSQASGKPAPGEPPPVGPGGVGNGADSTLGGAPPADMGNIDQILEGDEEVLSGGNGFTYDPGNRRDPFKSLLVAPDRPEFRGPRPEGVPGLLIDEIDLKGVYRTARGWVAQVNASNQKKSYLLKEGDQLYDGDVVSIGKNEVVFKQIVQDPTALKPFREVVKSLSPQ
jgi:hypothetical protein